VPSGSLADSSAQQSPDTQAPDTTPAHTQKAAANAPSASAPTDAPAPDENATPAATGSSFTKPVSILNSVQLFRRPEDMLTVRKVLGAKSLTWYLPNTWIPQPASREGVLREMRIPAPEKATYSDAIVFIYGSESAAGNDDGGKEADVYANLNLWLNEIVTPDYTPVIQEFDFADGTPLLLTTFAGVGTYAPKGAQPQPDMMVLGAIVEGGPEGTLFFKAVGPRKLVEDQKYRWDLVLRTLRIKMKPPGYD